MFLFLQYLIFEQENEFRRIVNVIVVLGKGILVVDEFIGKCKILLLDEIILYGVIKIIKLLFEYDIQYVY